MVSVTTVCRKIVENCVTTYFLIIVRLIFTLIIEIQIKKIPQSLGPRNSKSAIFDKLYVV